MDSDRLTGIGFMLLGISVLSSPVITIVSGTPLSTPLVSAGMAVAGLCLFGMGIGVLTGRFEANSGTTSRRSAALIAGIAIVAFAIGAVVALS